MWIQSKIPKAYNIKKIIDPEIVPKTGKTISHFMNTFISQYFDSMILLGRWGKPKDLIGPTLMLASEAGSFVTGETLTVDGGWMTR